MCSIADPILLGRDGMLINGFICPEYKCTTSRKSVNFLLPRNSHRPGDTSIVCTISVNALKFYFVKTSNASIVVVKLDYIVAVQFLVHIVPMNK